MNCLFDESISEKVNALVVEFFGCEKHEITAVADTVYKKVAVFFLRRHFGFALHLIGRAYKMNYLFVETVTKQIEKEIEVDQSLKNKIEGIKRSLYEKVDQRRSSVA